MTIEDRLRRAVHEHAATIPGAPDRWDDVEARAARARRRTVRTMTFVGVGVAATGLAIALTLSKADREPVKQIVTAPSATPAPTRAPVPALSGGSLPLWPFASGEDVLEWKAANRDPWHLDPDETALRFTTGYLGFTEIDKVIRHDVRDDEAWVSVGSDTEGGRNAVGAVLHLRRFGSGPDAPWEVVGSRDSHLALTTPKYGAMAGSPLTVGGRITGVDEDIKVDVRQVSSDEPIGRSGCCLPAGGQDEPWQTSVSFKGATDGVLTVVAYTGGHLQGVERFAITGVRATA